MACEADLIFSAKRICWNSQAYDRVLFMSLPQTLKWYFLPVDEFDSSLYEINFLAKDTKARMKDKFDAKHTEGCVPVWREARSSIKRRSPRHEEGQRQNDVNTTSRPEESKSTCSNRNSNQDKVLKASSPSLTCQGILQCPLYMQACQEKQTTESERHGHHALLQWHHFNTLGFLLLGPSSFNLSITLGSKEKKKNYPLSAPGLLQYPNTNSFDRILLYFFKCGETTSLSLSSALFWS